MKIFKLFLIAIVFMAASSCEEVIVIPSVLSFDQTSDSGYEGTSYAIGISFDSPIDNQITINYSVSGTASSGVDYSLPSSLTVASGSTSATLDLDLSTDPSEISTYNAFGKTVIIEITEVTGSGNIQFGTTTFTYTILENDLQIFLSWSPSTGVAADHDLDLLLYDESLVTSSIPVFPILESVTTIPDEEIIMDENLNNEDHFVRVYYYGGAISSSNPNLTVTYEVRINFPDGSSSTNSDTFTLTDVNNDPFGQPSRYLFSITKAGEGSFSASMDPFGPGGRQALTALPGKSK